MRLLGETNGEEAASVLMLFIVVVVASSSTAEACLAIGGRNDQYIKQNQVEHTLFTAKAKQEHLRQVPQHARQPGSF